MWLFSFVRKFKDEQAGEYLVQRGNDNAGNMRRYFICVHGCNDRYALWEQANTTYFCFCSVFHLSRHEIEIFTKTKRRGIVV